MCFLLLWKRLDETMKDKMDIRMKNFHIIVTPITHYALPITHHEICYT
jgi:hypothetical protein